jgi:hypothetical protein
MIDQCRNTMQEMATAMLSSDGCFASCSELLTEEELITFLRIPEVTSSTNHHNVIEHLKRYRGLPRMRICNKVLYPMEAVRKWIESQTINVS